MDLTLPIFLYPQNMKKFMKMKKYQLSLAALLGITLMTGCEMKEEIWSKDKDTRAQGVAELSVAVKQPYSMTRAENEVSTADFPVTIQGTGEVADIVKTFAKASELPQEIALPVGTYTVTAHTPGELQKQMSSPYYGGEKEMVITQGITTETKVTCKMKNSRIQVNYGDDFKQNFSEWTMTVEDGSENALAYSNENLDPAAVFWSFGTETVTTIRVNIRAKTTAGNTVSESRAFKKSDASEQYGEENDFFEGGDAIQIQMGAVASSTGHVTGITINTYVTFEDKNEEVLIPVSIPVTIKEPADHSYLATGLTINESSYPTDVQLNVAAEAGLQHLYIKMGSSNSAFTSAVTAYTSGDGVDLIGATEATAANYFGALPTSGDKAYSLTLATTLMQLMQQHAGTHTLTIKAVDTNGNPLVKELRATVTKSEEPETPVEDENKPNITFQTGVANITYISANEVSYSMEALPEQFTAYIKAPKKIESIVVKIRSGNTAFADIIKDVRMDGQNFIDGINIVDNAEFNGLLAGQELTGVSKGDTSYDFPIGVFFTFLNITGVTDAGKAHEFDINITDQEGNSVNDVLKIHITE